MWFWGKKGKPSKSKNKRKTSEKMKKKVKKNNHFVSGIKKLLYCLFIYFFEGGAGEGEETIVEGENIETEKTVEVEEGDSEDTKVE